MPQVPDGYDWRLNPLGLADPNAWVGANDPSRALDITATTPATGKYGSTIGSMLSKYNAGGYTTPAATIGTPDRATAKSVPAGDMNVVTMLGTTPGARAGTTTGDTRGTGNMFLDRATDTGARGTRGAALPASIGGQYGNRGGGDQGGARAGEYIPATSPGMGGYMGMTGGQRTGEAGGPPRSIGNPASGGYGVQQYLDPGYDFRFDEGLRALQSGAAAGGNFLSGQTMKDLMQYGQGAASQEYGNAYNRMAADRNFNTALDQWNKTFGRDTAVSDRNYLTALDQWNKTFGRDTSQMDWGNDTQTLQMLLNAGLAGASGSSAVQQLLARLLSANAIASGAAGAGNTQANSNLIAEIIGQLLRFGNQPGP